MPSVLGFLRHYLRPRPGVVTTDEITYRRGDEELPATLYRPAGARGPLPGWVVLHGLTFTGRHHPGLGRFARAFAAGGVAVLIPDMPEWRALRVAPAITASTIQSAIGAVEAHPGIISERVGLLGFSFGATQGIIACGLAQATLGLRAIAAWGGYYDIHNLFRFGILGEHELDGVQYRADPDPYGRWMMGANYLTAIPGYEGMGDAAAALHRLASEAGRRGLFAADPAYDPFKAELRVALVPGSRDVFDLFAPIGRHAPEDLERAADLAPRLADAALRVDPLLDPKPLIAGLTIPTLLAHGRDDRLVPFTESLRMRRALPETICVAMTITSLFAHSGGASGALGVRGRIRESARFVALLKNILDLV